MVQVERGVRDDGRETEHAAQDHSALGPQRLQGGGDEVASRPEEDAQV